VILALAIGGPVSGRLIRFDRTRKHFVKGDTKLSYGTVIAYEQSKPSTAFWRITEDDRPPMNPGELIVTKYHLRNFPILGADLWVAIPEGQSDHETLAKIFEGFSSFNAVNRNDILKARLIQFLDRNPIDEFGYAVRKPEPDEQ